ncbi:alpha/beta fold hydrolase, partial [bacterium]|nr:alpha/beta fold hydrolase [bacterium]
MKFFLLISLFVFSRIFAGSYEIVPMGDFVLDNGQTISQSELAVRTWGCPNADSSNIVIFPTWFAGKTEHIGWFIRPGGLVDSTNFFVIAIGAFGNGESSSPSTSMTQPSDLFPMFTIRDMVRAQHQMLTQIKGILHVHAVVGGSMGGMQVFEWLVRYPDFMDKAVPYVSSPQLTSYDLLRQRCQVEFIEMGLRNGIAADSLMGLVSTIQHAATYSPA